MKTFDELMKSAQGSVEREEPVGVNELSGRGKSLSMDSFWFTRLMKDLYSKSKVPGEVWSGEKKYSTDEQVKWAADLVEMLGLGGMGAAALGAVPRESAGIFGAKLAKDFDPMKARRAQFETAIGESPENVWKSTGYGGKGLFADKEMRFEIPDHMAEMSQVGLNRLRGGEELPWKKVIQHDDLYRNYPEMAEYKVRMEDLRGKAGGYFDPSAKAMVLDRSLDKDNALSVALHEAQHGVQDIEGLARGGSPEEFIPKNYEKRFSKLQKEAGSYWPKAVAGTEDMAERLLGKKLDRDTVGELIDEAAKVDLRELGEKSSAAAEFVKALWAHPEIKEYLQRAKEMMWLKGEKEGAVGKYWNLAGEAEARLVPRRKAMGVEQRQGLPPTSPKYLGGYDVPLEQQVVKRNPLR